jgi:hypothetical protein
VSQKITCPNCGKRFTPWRGKRYCSERCRKHAENQRLRGSESPAGIIPFAGENLPPESQGNRATPKAVRGDEPLIWVACNEVTWRLARGGRPATETHCHAAGWAMQIEGRGWYGRVRDDRGDWSFGPSTLTRARDAVEAYLRREPFEKTDNERSWSGDCGRLLVGHELSAPRPSLAVAA